MLSYLGPAYHHILYEMIQYYAACFVLNKPWHRQQQNDSITDILTYLKWPCLEVRKKVSHLTPYSLR